MAASDFQEPYLAAVFRLLGIEDVEFVCAEGVALGPDHREASIAQALASVPATVARVATAHAA